MKQELKVFCVKWNEIPEGWWPRNGEVYICLDPQETLGKGTWSVSIMDRPPNDITRLGMFWNVNKAVLFGSSYIKDLGNELSGVTYIQESVLKN